MSLLPKGVTSLLPGSPASPRSLPPSLEETGQETASQVMANQSKIEVGHQAVLLEQMRAIAHDEIQDVRRLKRKYLGEQWAGPVRNDDMGDLIVCDDYHKNDPQQPHSSRIWPWVAASIAGAGLGLGGFLGALALTKSLPSVPPAVQNIEKTEGFLIDLEQAPRKP